MTAPTPPRLVPWTRPDIAPTDPSVGPLFVGIRIKKTILNHTVDGVPGLDYTPGVMTLEIGTLPPFQFSITKDRAEVDIPASATKTLVGGEPWRLVWLPSGGTREVVGSGQTVVSRPCCGD